MCESSLYDAGKVRAGFMSAREVAKLCHWLSGCEPDKPLPQQEKATAIITPQVNEDGVN